MKYDFERFCGTTPSAVIVLIGKTNPTEKSDAECGSCGPNTPAARQMSHEPLSYREDQHKGALIQCRTMESSHRER